MAAGGNRRAATCMPRCCCVRIAPSPYPRSCHWSRAWRWPRRSSPLAPPDADVRVKWPNDVLIRGAKVAGLLLESAPGARERVAWVVVGSGVNIASAPGGTPYPATALRYEGFPPVTPLHVLERYLGALDGLLARWRAGGFAAVRPAWLALGSGIGDRVRLRLGREEVAGRFVDVTEQGALLVAQDGNRRRQISAGELLLQER